MCFDRELWSCTKATVKGTLGSHCELLPNLCEHCAWDSRIAITTFSHRFRKELICTDFPGALFANAFDATDKVQVRMNLCLRINLGLPLCGSLAIESE